MTSLAAAAPGVDARHTPTRRRRAGWAGWLGPRLVTIGLLLLCFSGNWDALGSPAPLDRAVLYSGIALCTLDFFGRGGRLTIRPVHLFMVLALACASLSAIWVGTFRGSGMFALVDRFGLFPFMLLVLAPAIYSDPRSRRFFARTFALFGLYLGFTAIAQMLGIERLVWPDYILDPGVGLHSTRARGPFAESVANGLMLIYTGAVAGFVASMDPSRHWRRLARLAIVLCLIGVVLTLTRAVWLGAALAALASLAAVPQLRRRAPVIAVLGAAAAALAFVLVPGLDVLVSDRGSSQGPLWDRYNTNLAAVRMLLENPLTGVGWRHSRDVMEEYVRQGGSYPVTAATAGLDVHNVFLGRLAELGIPTTALWLGALAGATIFPLVRRAESRELQAWRAVLLPVVIAWTVAAMFGPLTYPQPNYVLWCLAGIVLVAYLTGSPPRGAPADAPLGEPAPAVDRVPDAVATLGR